MRSFASDNNSGVHPRVMDAIINANDNHAVGYGDDPWTEAEKRSPVPDFRHTLLWRPDIRTNGESSISIPFTTSDMTGDFTITIEGLTQTGEALYATEQFQVK